ncbi:hypothetical protein IWX62_000550, partial [Arthrobacter sp. CAN_A1]
GPTNEPKTTKSPEAGINRQRSDQTDDHEKSGLSLESWRREHRRYWTRVSAAQGRHWSESDDIVFERFSVVWPPEHADSALA